MHEFVNSEYYDFTKQESVAFNYVKNPNRSELQEYVDAVVNVLVADGHYHPLMRNIVADFLLIYIFSDIDVHDILESNDAAMEEYVNSNTIAAVIKDGFGTDLTNEIMEAIDDGIAYKVGFYKNPVSVEFAKLINKINNFATQINVDDMEKFIKNVNSIEDNLTADKIVNAYATSEEVATLYKEADKRREKQNDAILEIIKGTATKETGDE